MPHFHDCGAAFPPREQTAVLTLFQRDDCHLCDMALAELARARAPEFESVFLDDQPALEARYGARVPVLRDERGGRELDWPFDAATVQAWLSAGG
nr:glutaredoxin family protein [Stenotrophomonas indicatrix]